MAEDTISVFKKIYAETPGFASKTAEEEYLLKALEKAKIERCQKEAQLKAEEARKKAEDLQKVQEQARTNAAKSTRLALEKDYAQQHILPQRGQ